MARRHATGRMRQGLQAVFVGLMAMLALLPMAAQLAGFNTWRAGENRAQAIVPTMPRDLPALHAWPRAAEAALNDRFGLRTQLVSLHDRILFQLFGVFASNAILAGPGGRLFLSSDWTRSLIRQGCGKALPDGEVARLAAEAEAMLRALRDRAPRVDLLVVPSAPVLYPEELPAWLRPDCDTGTPLAQQVLGRLPPEWRAHAFFPIERLREPDPRGPAIPLRHLHWDAVGAAAGIGAWAEEHRQLGRLRELETAWHRRPSDLGGFFPGLALSSMVLEVAPDASGIEQCLGWPCFPANAEAARILVDVRRLRVADAGAGRVLVLSDSYGSAAAPWLLRHIGEVTQVTVNNADPLSPDQRRRLAQALLEEYRPDQVLVVIPDISLHLTLPRVLSLLE
jgi:hypothetical protein